MLFNSDVEAASMDMGLRDDNSPQLQDEEAPFIDDEVILSIWLY